MFKRIIYGLLAGAAVIFIILCLPKFVANIIVTLIAIGGIYEFINVLKSANYNPLRLIPYASCMFLMFINSAISLGLYKFSLAICAISILVLLIYALFLSNRNLIDICLSVFAILYIPFLLSFVLSTYYLEDVGKYAIWLILFGACGTDACAYFIGVKFGKHKLCPNISPKKTVEGAIGGIVGNCLILLVYAFCLNKWCGFNIQYWQITIFAAILSVSSQIGDLVASSIKRFVNTKDFGSCLPGHGGVLDRIDSVLFAAPVTYYFLILFPLLFK